MSVQLGIATGKVTCWDQAEFWKYASYSRVLLEVLFTKEQPEITKSQITITKEASHAHPWLLNKKDLEVIRNWQWHFIFILFLTLKAAFFLLLLNFWDCNARKHSLPTVKSDTDKSCIANIIHVQLLFCNSVPFCLHLILFLVLMSNCDIKDKWSWWSMTKIHADIIKMA